MSRSKYVCMCVYVCVCLCVCVCMRATKKNKDNNETSFDRKLEAATRIVDG